MVSTELFSLLFFCLHPRMWQNIGVIKLLLLVSKSRLGEYLGIGKEIYGSYYPIDAAGAVQGRGWNAEPCDNQELNQCLTPSMCPCISALICTRKETKLISLCKSTWRYFDKPRYSNTAFSKVSPLCTAKARLNKLIFNFSLPGFANIISRALAAACISSGRLLHSLAGSRSPAEQGPSPGLLPAWQRWPSIHTAQTQPQGTARTDWAVSNQNTAYQLSISKCSCVCYILLTCGRSGVCGWLWRTSSTW